MPGTKNHEKNDSTKTTLCIQWIMVERLCNKDCMLEFKEKKKKDRENVLASERERERV